MGICTGDTNDVKRKKLTHLGLKRDAKAGDVGVGAGARLASATGRIEPAWSVRCRKSERCCDCRRAPARGRAVEGAASVATKRVIRRGEEQGADSPGATLASSQTHHSCTALSSGSNRQLRWSDNCTWIRRTACSYMVVQEIRTTEQLGFWIERSISMRPLFGVFAMAHPTQQFELPRGPVLGCPRKVVKM